MADVVVTVPKSLWEDWLDEGDLPGDSWHGDFWSFHAGGSFPASVQRTGERWNADGFWPEPDGLRWNDLADWDREWWLAAPDQRCYIVAHGRLRGFAPLFAIEVRAGTGALKAFIRRGDAPEMERAKGLQDLRGDGAGAAEDRRRGPRGARNVVRRRLAMPHRWDPDTNNEDPCSRCGARRRYRKVLKKTSQYPKTSVFAEYAFRGEHSTDNGRTWGDRRAYQGRVPECRGVK